MLRRTLLIGVRGANRIQVITLLMLSAGLWTDVSAATIQLTFESDSNKPTPFTETIGGLTATYSSSADPYGFVVEDFLSSRLQQLTGQILLYDPPVPTFGPSPSLSIHLSSPQSLLFLDFVTNSPDNPQLVLNAFRGDAFVGAAEAIGAVPPLLGFFPEGQLSFTGNLFDRIVLTSPARAFGIDNVTVSDAPEPTTLTLYLAGFCLLLRSPGRRRANDR